MKKYTQNLDFTSGLLKYVVEICQQSTTDKLIMKHGFLESESFEKYVQTEQHLTTRLADLRQPIIETERRNLRGHSIVLQSHFEPDWLSWSNSKLVIEVLKFQKSSVLICEEKRI
jgi:tRNA isopentenyl-2-thiomethyl-A-37 hydroxylase MiaE